MEGFNIVRLSSAFPFSVDIRRPKRVTVGPNLELDILRGQEAAVRSL